MKTKILLISIVAAFTLSISAKAQNIGGKDIRVSASYHDSNYSKISVADNGWIYILIYTSSWSGPFTTLELRRSIDGGETYQKLKSWELSGHATYDDVDMVVTGNSAANINVWIAFVVNNSKTDSSGISILKYAADGTYLGAPYSYNNIYHDTYNVAIATDYRSPGDGANPFAIAIAFTDYVPATNKSWVNYAYSLDGGANFNLKSPYSLVGKSKFGRIDLSLGRSRYNKFGMVGIVFEIGDREPYGWRGIGFLANYMDYRTNHSWSAPVILTKNNAQNPKVQWFGNNDVNPTVNGVNSFNFIVAYDRKTSDTDVDALYVYPATSFKIAKGHTPVTSDFRYSYFGVSSYVNEQDAALSFDKRYNHYLATYVEKAGDVYKLKYKYVSADKIHQASSWVDLGNYLDNENYARYPAIDINPAKAQVCWSWTSNYVYADAEWRVHTDVEEINTAEKLLSLSPNPASGTITLRLQEHGIYSARIYNMLGAQIETFNFTGSEYTRDVTALPFGLYLIKLNAGNGRELSAKFMVK